MGRLSLLLGLVLVLAVLMAPREALAHAVLLETEPVADSVLDAAPDKLVLHFNEPVQPVSFRLIDADGLTVADESDARAVDHRIELSLAEPLARGGYIVTWRVISADSHPVGGSWRFAVGAMPDAWLEEEAAPVAAPDTRFWTIGLAAARSVFLFGLVLSAGGAWFALIVARGGIDVSASRIVMAGALAGAIAGFMGVGFQGGLLHAAAPAEALSVPVWSGGLSTPLGQAMAASSLALLVLAALSASRSAVSASIAGLLAMLPLAYAGHVATAEPRWISAPSVLLHAIVAGFWLGSLPPLLVATGRWPADEAAMLLTRFSRLAVIAVALLVGAGTLIAAIQLRGLSPLWETSYGLLLSGKLALVAGLMLIAVRNKQRLTPALVSGREDTRRGLRRNIAVEIALIALVLVLTASLGFNTPPRALQHAHDDHHHAHDHGDEHHHEHAHDHGHTHDHGHEHHHGETAMQERATVRGTTVELTLSPGRAGANLLEVRVEDAEGERVDPLEVEARFSSEDLGIEPVARRLEAHGDHFALRASDMALPGLWQVRIDVLVTDFDKPIFTFEIDVR